MKPRPWGALAIGLGVLSIAVGLVVRFVIFPDQARFPDDTDTTRIYAGELAVLLNAPALETLDLQNLFLRDVPVTIDRRVQTLETDGGDALVSDAAVMSGPAGPIESSEDIYAIDRTTMEHVGAFADDARVIPREGLVIGWPIGTEQQDYTGWNGDTLEPVTLTYTGEEERAGLDTYVFHASSDPQKIVDPVLLASFPPALPKDLLAGLAPALGLPDALAAQLGELLPALPDPVPLAYTYAFDKTYWVEPASGILIDIDVMESRSVGLEIPASGEIVPLAEVQRLTYSPTEESVADAVADADDARSLLQLWGSTVPYLAIGLGAVLVLIGLWLARRRREPEPVGERGKDTVRA